MCRDPEFDMEPSKNRLSQYFIKREPIKTRKHNQAGTVKHKNQALKIIMLRFSLADPCMEMNALAARANLLSHVFAGSCIAKSLKWLTKIHFISFPCARRMSLLN